MQWFFLTAREKIFCGDTHYARLTRLTEVTAHFRPENNPLQDALYQYIILINLFMKKEYNRAKICQPVALNSICSSILSTFVNVCQRALL